MSKLFLFDYECLNDAVLDEITARTPESCVIWLCLDEAIDPVCANDIITAHTGFELLAYESNGKLLTLEHTTNQTDQMCLELEETDQEQEQSCNAHTD